MLPVAHEAEGQLNWAQRNRLAFQAKAYAHGWRVYHLFVLRRTYRKQSPTTRQDLPYT